MLIASSADAGDSDELATESGATCTITNADRALAVAVDSAGNFYATGFDGVHDLGTPDFPVTSGTFQNGYGCGDADAWVAKFRGDETVEYVSYLGGAGRDVAAAIAADDQGNAYVAGTTRSPRFASTEFSLQPFNTAYAGAQKTSAFVAKINPAGTQIEYAATLTDQSEAIGIAIDDAGHAYVTGYTGAQASGGTDDAFVAKLNPTGSQFVYSGLLGGTGSDIGHGIAVDSIGNVWVSGGTGSSDFPVVKPYQSMSAGVMDAFVTRLTSTAGPVWPISATTRPDYPLSSTFGPREKASDGDRYDWHRGIDIPTPCGTPVRAIADGAVDLSDGDSTLFEDRVIRLRHDDGTDVYYSLYLHLSAPIETSLRTAAARTPPSRSAMSAFRKRPICRSSR